MSMFEKLREDVGKHPAVREAAPQQRAVLATARLIYNWRKAAGLSQLELANRIGTKQEAISRLERGTSKEGPKLSTLAVIAEACGQRLVLGGRPAESDSTAEVSESATAWTVMTDQPVPGSPSSADDYAEFEIAATAIGLEAEESETGSKLDLLAAAVVDETLNASRDADAGSDLVVFAGDFDTEFEVRLDAIVEKAGQHLNELRPFRLGARQKYALRCRLPKERMPGMQAKNPKIPMGEPIDMIVIADSRGAAARAAMALQTRGAMAPQSGSQRGDKVGAAMVGFQHTKKDFENSAG